jgi:hypothetical protein
MFPLLKHKVRIRIYYGFLVIGKKSLPEIREFEARSLTELSIDLP